MSAHRGSCFRALRRTKIRKARQAEAIAALQKAFPTMRGVPRFEDMSEVGKQRLIESYKLIKDASSAARRHMSLR